MRLRVYTEYMDSKRNFGADWFEVLRRLYAHKYVATRFDVVISTDDNAYWFLLRYQPELFPGCPVVFCGVNSYDAVDLEGRPLFTGLPEIVDVQATLETALRLHPDIEIVHVLVDRTPTGNSTRKNLVKKVEPSFAGRLRFRYLDDLPMERVLQEVKRIGRRGILLLLNYNRDGLGRVYSHHEAIDLLAAATSARSTASGIFTWDEASWAASCLGQGAG